MPGQPQISQSTAVKSAAMGCHILCGLFSSPSNLGILVSSIQPHGVLVGRIFTPNLAQGPYSSVHALRVMKG